MAVQYPQQNLTLTHKTMKKISILIISFFIFSNIFSQSGFSYQGVLRNEAGKLRTNETLELTVNLVKGDSVLYTEKHQVITNSYAVFSMVVGQGASTMTYSPSLFLNNDSTTLNVLHLKVLEGENEISNTQILGVPFAEVAKVALKAHIDFPAGSIIAFGGEPSQIPHGWLLCDGKGYDKNIYNELFAAISTNWGRDGDLFRVPDLRGAFLRGTNYDQDDEYSDPDRALRSSRNGGNTGNSVGSFQADTMASHQHKIELLYGRIIQEGAGGNILAWGRANNQAYTTAVTGSFENRPVNAYVNYIIKY